MKGDVEAGMSNLAHVYPQRRWHDEAYIVGDEAALRRLAKAIKQALAGGQGSCETFAADGEGYEVVVVRLRDPGLWDLLRLPYADDYAVDGRKEAIGPRELLVKLRRRPGV
ncbi:MAG: hypothetical protein QME87_09970 [Bacillota bacterium]|nr:hypothetical protein [Bacillota bacterium]